MTYKENELELKFSTILGQIERSLQLKLYYVALITSLTIPDICGAIDSESGESDKNKYINWFDTYVKKRFTNNRPITGTECYYLRCAVLHQGITNHSKNPGNISFVSWEQASTNINPFLTNDHLGLIVETNSFCYNIIYGAYEWLDKEFNSIHFKKNMENFITLYSLVFNEL
jgi:hypothetical protein